ncbi:hypothetical protein V7128_29805 [Neobacillus vireti]|uniref:hypothetical protein n=1 Tax=Neobacillus vireti TaxID=220686 RepID=UPI002FFDE4AC
MNKQEIETAIKTSIQCQLTFTTTSGEKIELTSYFVLEIENLTVEDEDGNEIQSSEEVSFK